MIKTREAAEVLGLTQATIRNLIASGELEAIRSSTGTQSHYLIDEREIRRWIRKQKVTPQPASEADASG